MNGTTMTETQALNRQHGIDVRNGKTREELLRDRPPTVKKSMWVQRIHELVGMVAAERAEIGVYYKLGQFKSGSGARQTIHNLSKRVSELPAVSVDLEAVDREDGGSELWAAVVV